LRQGRRLYPLQAGKPYPLVAPGLFIAGSGLGPAAADSRRWKDLLATLDAFKALGMNAVSVMIAAPDLSLGDPKPLIDFYQRLAGALHARGMKLYVEHFDNPPFSPHAHKGLQDTPPGRRDFLAMRERELTLIYREIKPDFLSILTEPGTMGRWSRLTFSADELADWVGDIAARLKGTDARTHTLLGAGAGSWESEDFVLQVARQAKLDYVDMHLYALKLNGDDMLARLATRVRKVREARPNLTIAIGETWLYKHGANEPHGMLNRDAYFRDNFGFWSPLDEQFFKLLMGIAQKEYIAVAAPYFSQYFFAYYRFGDAEAVRLPQWPGSVFVSWSQALEAIRRQQVSATGRAVGALLRDGGTRRP
jgi:hypothetical protein